MRSLDIGDINNLTPKQSTIINEMLSDIALRIGETVQLDTNVGDDTLKIETGGKKFVAEIYRGGFGVGDGRDREDHIGINISEEFRKRGIATKLYEVWQELGYELPEYEYTRDPNKVDFFESLGYTPCSIISDTTGEEEEIYGKIPEGKLGEGYSCKFILES